MDYDIGKNFEILNEKLDYLIQLLDNKKKDD